MSVEIFGDGIPVWQKGDIFIGDGTAAQRIPVGTDGQILVERATSPTGYEWTDFDLGTPQAFVEIARATSSGSISTITFSSIPQTYTDLLMIGLTASTSNAGAGNITMTFNQAASTTTGVLYLVSRWVAGAGSTLTENTPSKVNNTYRIQNFIINASRGNWVTSTFFMKIHNYATSQASFNFSVGGFDESSGLTGNESDRQNAGQGGGTLRGASAPVSTIEFTSDNGINGLSRFFLYGIKGI